MENFTPVSAAIGGALIGLAAALLMLTIGRLAGISGIFGGCLAWPLVARMKPTGRREAPPDDRLREMRGGLATLQEPGFRFAPSGLQGFGTGDKGWRIAFIAGLILAPLIGGLAGFPVPLPDMPASWIVIVAAGLLVGFGTRLGGGCTSGHGVCGIARLSPRSIVATGIFMGVAIVVVAFTRHVFAG